MFSALSGKKRRLAHMITIAVGVSALFMLASCNALGDGGGSHIEGPPRDTTPVVLDIAQPGISVVSDANNSAVVDFSNAAEGYICVMSNLNDIVVKVLVDVAGSQYQYTIDEPGSYITIPLSQGNGTYAVGVWQNVTGDQYAAVLSQTIEVTLNDELKPFLYPSQYVSFSSGDEAVSLSQQLAEGSVTDVDAINNIYEWVCQNIDYDVEEATTVVSGYLPENSSTLSKKKGICFDYAVLTASMLRAQQVPAKLVIGYAGSAYHAWLEVYSLATGSVISYEFNGSSWVRMDPTFDAASGGLEDLTHIIGDGTSYQPLFYY